jgi:hypothetical protein
MEARGGDDIRRVKEVFGELQLQAVCERWNAQMMNELSAAVERVCAQTGVPKAIFDDSLARFLADPRRDLSQARG